jgi:hypothetical protein
MSSAALDALRFPIGEFLPDPRADAASRQRWIATITQFPRELRALVVGRSAAVLAQTYRPGGWNVKQLVHHCADSHLNAYLRFKLALTEERPTIKAYNEAAWAELPDGKAEDLGGSLAILEGVHDRWGKCLLALSETDWQRTFYHPEHGNSISLALSLEHYDWHCRHHLAHLNLCLACPL